MTFKLRRSSIVVLVSLAVVAGIALVRPAEPAGALVGPDIVVLGGASAVSNSVVSQLATCTGGSVTRIAGANRYATAAAVSSTFLGPGVDVAYVATGENFPDALAGSAAAGAGAGGPVLLVRPTSVPAETAAELARLKPKVIVVLGGTAAISAGVEAALGSYGTVVRVAGSNRYATGAMVSGYAFPVGADTAYVATGTNFPDALAGGPAAVAAKGPVLLVDPHSIPASVKSELARLGLTKIKVLGGTAAVSAAVEAELAGYAGSVSRLSGSNRYATAAAVSRDTFTAGVSTIFVATGRNFPDALAGGPIAGILGGPILLVEQDSIPNPTEVEIERLTGVDCATPPPPSITFGDGTWVVGSDIPAGTYQTAASPGWCYAERLSGFGGTLDDVIVNELSYDPLIVTIEAGDAGFSSQDCDLWTNDTTPRTSSPTAGFGSGYWVVGGEVAPGLWRNSDSSEWCYWERLSGFSWESADIIANGLSYDIQTVRIGSGDAGFNSNDCGTWAYLGP